MSHIKSCVALVYLTMAFLLLHMNITSSGLDISHTAIQITGLLNMDSPEERNLSTKTELLSKNANLHILLKQIAAELNAARARLTFSKHGKDSRANITKGTIRKVSAQTEELYFELVKTYTNSEFILVRANHKKLLGKYFSIAGNNCLEIKKNALRGIYSLERLNRTCTESMDSLLQNVGLQPNLLSVAMPGHKVYTSEEGYLLTYFHIFMNAVVSPDGDVYFQDVHVIPWRCKQEPALSWSRLQKGQVYDKVPVKYLACKTTNSFKPVRKNNDQGKISITIHDVETRLFDPNRGLNK